MPERQIMGRTVYDPPRRLIAGADCWLSEDGRWILAARLIDPVLRWRSEDEAAALPEPLTWVDKVIQS